MTNRSTIEALDESIDLLLADEDPGSQDPLVGLAAAIRESSRVDVPAALAQGHIDAAASLERGVTVLRPSRRSRRLTVGLAAAAMVVLMASSAVAASTAALPGEAFYGVKRVVEQVRLSLPGSAGAKAQLHLEFADRRLSELQDLLARRDAGEDVDVGAAIAAYGKELAKAERDAGKALAKGRDDVFIARVLERIDRHVQRLEFLRDNRVPEQARDAIQRAIDNAEKAKGKVGKGRDGEKGKPDDSPGKGQKDAPGQKKKAERAPVSD